MKRLLVLVLWAVLFSVVLQAQETTVQFSVSGGFYDSTFCVALSCEDDGLVIRYTTNGNAPTIVSKVYSEPLLLDENLFSHSNIFTVQDCIDSLWFVPESVKRSIIIRAAAFDIQGNRCSDVVTNSYFIKSLGCNTHGLPVVSLCADSLDLFDYERGIMVSGSHFDIKEQLWTGNYYQHGQEWERLCNVEFYELDNAGINQQAGLRTHGGNARREQQKGLKIYARREYGNKYFSHRFFEDFDNVNYRRLVLKPYRDLAQALRDEVATRIARTLNVEYVASRPAVLFLNGEYWGIYYIKERPDEHYLTEHFGGKPKDYNLVEKWGAETQLEEDNSFVGLMRWLENADLSQEKDYAHFCSLVDVDCFIDYQCLEIFTANLDWPANNTRCWQNWEGKWRWIFYDGDGCFADRDFDVFANALYDGDEIWPASKLSTLMLRKLVENKCFIEVWCDRFGALLLDELNERKAKAYFEEAYGLIENEIENQVERFGKPNLNIIETERDNFGFFYTDRLVSMAEDLHYFSRHAKDGQYKTTTMEKRRKPFSLLKMAWHFKDWRYVKVYHDFKRQRRRVVIKSSGIYKWWSGTWLHRKIKGE